MLQIYPESSKIHDLPRSAQGTVGSNASAGQNGSGFLGKVPCASPAPVPDLRPAKHQ